MTQRLVLNMISDAFVRSSIRLIAILYVIALSSHACAQSVDAETQVDTQVQSEQNAALPSRRYAILVVGLPGDEEHRERYREMVDVWSQWLIQVVGVGQKDIVRLGGDAERDDIRLATIQNVKDTLADLNEKVRSTDSVWVFTIGHGSQDDRHGWFHIPGPDLNAVQWAGLFASLRAEEQVFWLTHSASGSFVKPFSRPGRVVITASDDGEINETRFPQALTKVMRGQLEQPTHDSGGTPNLSSVLKIFRDTVGIVNELFEEDSLVPTEHPQLDDNGDGSGTEATAVAEQQDGDNNVSSVIDGANADRIRLVTPIENEVKDQP
ncbi:hypothetical protein [Aporhodopirellula aestuarii]|uniref:Uncharacterized protein n=1 Tax=Aporhodopirellula aestuarii TaxID=2950107 RepID=A0ABT0U761_9BACT|nr:hypothetical protein [Aporhodopirellula aestuarii]MCM2372770.1 hypothetical protein [Aporhodopirellula aestuarii]